MSIPSIGSLGMISCPNGVCTSISEAIYDGCDNAPYSLSSLSECAGFSTPYCISKFYNFDNFQIDQSEIINISAEGGLYDITVCGPSPITYIFENDLTSWVNETVHPTICPNGAISTVCVSENTGDIRNSSIYYTPSFGTQRTVMFCQYGAGTAACPICFAESCHVCATCEECRIEELTGMQKLECAGVTLGYTMYRDTSTADNLFEICCNSSVIFSCCICGAICSCSVKSTYGPILYNFGDVICATIRACVPNELVQACSVVKICTIYNCVGIYCISCPSCAIASIPHI